MRHLPQDIDMEEGADAFKEAINNQYTSEEQLDGSQ